MSFRHTAGIVLLAACTSNADAARESPIPGDVAAQIAQRIDVREDQTVFALFAMLNAAGYDDETNAQMHPVRRAVRAALPRRLPDSVFARVEAFYKAHVAAADAGTYAAVALATWGAPNFLPTAAWTDDLSKKQPYESLKDLPGLLRTFHRAFPVDSVYRTQQLEYRAYMADYTAAIRREVSAALNYVRVRDAGELSGAGERGRVVVIPNLLLSYDQSFSFTLDDTFYSIEGPQKVIGYNPHEFIHAVLNPVSVDTIRNAAFQRKALTAYAVTRSAKRPAVASLNTLAAFIEENLVRAVSLRYRAARDPSRDSASVVAAASDAHAGLVLVPYFYDQLKRYEAQSETLRAYYPKLFEQLGAQRELDRWRDSTARP